MKKLLAAGDAAKSFSSPACSATASARALHHPEFTMLEWYRADEPYRDLMYDCEALLRACLAAAGTHAFRWQGKSCDPTRAVRAAERRRRFPPLLRHRPAGDRARSGGADRALLADAAQTARRRVA